MLVDFLQVVAAPCFDVRQSHFHIVIGGPVQDLAVELALVEDLEAKEDCVQVFR